MTLPFTGGTGFTASGAVDGSGSRGGRCLTDKMTASFRFAMKGWRRSCSVKGGSVSWREREENESTGWSEKGKSSSTKALGFSRSWKWLERQS